MYEHLESIRVPAIIGIGQAFDIHAGKLRAGTAVDESKRHGVALWPTAGTAKTVAAISCLQHSVHLPAAS